MLSNICLLYYLQWMAFKTAIGFLFDLAITFPSGLLDLGIGAEYQL